MILYLDTSSLVKLYVEEDHGELVWEWATAAEAIATSRVAHPETLSALARRAHRGDLDATSFALARDAFEGSWKDFVRLDLDEELAGRLAVRHLLRGFDAIHLAAACELRDALAPGVVLFSSFDLALLAAARAEGIDCLTPEPWASEIMENAARYG
jgi:predicted nucleic acid-binding protein